MRPSNLGRALANLIVPGMQDLNFPHSFLKFRSIFLISLKLFSFSSSFWPFGWASHPPGNALATPLNLDRKIVTLRIILQRHTHTKIKMKYLHIKDRWIYIYHFIKGNFHNFSCLTISFSYHSRTCSEQKHFVKLFG